MTALYDWEDLSAAVELSSRTRKDGPVSATAVKPKAGQGTAEKAPPARPQGKKAGSVTRGRGGQGAVSSLPDPSAAAPAPPSRRPKVTPVAPMRRETAKSMRKLAAHVQGTHPDMTVHEHLRDAARTLEKGNEEGAQRHLRAAMFALTPQSLMRNGLHTDEHHQAAREAMHSVHRHMLLTKDIADVAAKNQQALARAGTGDDMAAPPHPDPNNGYGPSALAQKPAARQPPGDQALNAPNKADGGGSDPAVADPNGPQRPGSKQFSYGWDDLARVIDLVGPKGYIHGWIYEGGPGLPSVAGHNAKMKARGVTPPTKAHPALTSKPPGVKTAAAPKTATGKGTLTGSRPADKLTVAASPNATAKALSGADLKSADQEMARRAALLGKSGQVSKAHKAVRAEIARRTATGPQAARAAPKGTPAAGNALRGDAAYAHVAEPAGKKERDAADYYSVASGRLNPALRNGTALTDKTDKAQLRNLESAFAKAPPTTRHIVAYRGTTGALFGKDDATGTHFTDKGFTSVSTDSRQAGMFGSESDPALMEIHVPAGSRVVKPGGAGHYSEGDEAEKELVLNHGAHYEITSDQMVNDPVLGKIRKLTATYRGPA